MSSPFKDEPLDSSHTSVEEEQDRVPVRHSSSDHRLTDRQRIENDSEVEEMARKYEKRRADRILVTFDVRKRLLKTCKKIGKEKGYPFTNKIQLRDLEKFRNNVKTEVDQQKDSFWNKTKKRLGFRNSSEALLKVLERAYIFVNEIQLDEDDWFYYQDFNYFNTHLESRWPWWRNDLLRACWLLLLFYLSTPILFCAIVHDEGVCQPNENGDYGWVSALYFASTTMSTVGYGDLSVNANVRWRGFIGIVYMIVSLVVAIMAFSAAADNVFTPFGIYEERFLTWVVGDYVKGTFLHERIRWLKIVKLTEIAVEFFSLNLIGIFCVRLFILRSDLEGFQWTWMETFYWSVQTTTTIGYGDLNMSFEMRWFQIFYLIISTYFVGNALGKLGGLKEDLKDLRRQHAWQRREVSKGMIEDMQATENDGKIDQFEFLVASLLSLGKVTSDDVLPIMAKFRELSGDHGFIMACDFNDMDEPKVDSYDVELVERVDIHEL
eukprot:CAMPEP_0198292822 /NCGR_PEP_ID=MMETSP1449-20131203/14159_1 /TAXON_ID=420275 /ORGANISM="Attheya septentrionalis, Strain CCMP2084" /LENGTH=491 /DNA_ID=CAMNT_0043992135 /DNA_START=190 /DNA_END=1665 /DNA_ORIENTATION=+